MRKNLLHVGCGSSSIKDLKGFNQKTWGEIRFDIDIAASPDILGTLTDMSQVETNSIDAIYSSHNIEHLFAHEVPQAFSEFFRVLRDDGFLVLTCPDLQSVCAAVANDNLLGTLYQAPIGPIAAIDILYGERSYLQGGKIYMAHKCGFTYSVLTGLLSQAGFKGFYGGARPECYDLWTVAFKQKKQNSGVEAMALSFLP